MSFPLSLLFIPYGLFLVFFVIMSLVYLYHVLRYSSGQLGTYLFIALYALTAAVMMGVSVYYMSTVDWSMVLDFMPTTL